MTNTISINDKITEPKILYFGSEEDRINEMNAATISADETAINTERTYDAFKMLSTQDVANILRCTPATARQVMSRSDFPLIMAGKNYRVSEKAFAEWLMKRHTCNNFYS